MDAPVTLLCYPGCGTCRKAEKWLKEKGIAYNYRPIKEENPSEEELSGWIAKSGLPVAKFFNTSGQAYREKNMKEKVKTYSQKALVSVLAEDGMMVKRPILLADEQILVGFDEKLWADLLF